MSFCHREPFAIEAYSRNFSVVQGDKIGFRVSVIDGPAETASIKVFGIEKISIDVRLYGKAAKDAYEANYRDFISVHADETPDFEKTFPAIKYDVQKNASKEGCAWPVAVEWSVPSNQNPGVYFARFQCGDQITWQIFVVKPMAGNSTSTVLCQLAVNTYQAYNPFGGFSYYFPPSSKGRVNPVSFDRPCQLWDFILFDWPIVSWLLRNYSVEFCVDTDIIKGSEVYDGYNLVIVIGHNEYWTDVMRSKLEQFGRDGGNLMILSGNTCYRPVEYEGKYGLQMKNLFLESRDDGHPEALTTGLNWSTGRWNKPIPKLGYQVVAQDHWVFDGTGLKQGDDFGAKEGIVGYEVDAGVFDHCGKPVAPTPKSFVTLAAVELLDWDDWHGRTGTIGIFQRGDGGFVFNAGTTGWGQGLKADKGHVHTVTKNIINRFSCTPMST